MSERLTMTRTLAFASIMLLGGSACSTGPGETVERCSVWANGTDVRATTDDTTDGYDESTDPEALIAFNVSLGDGDQTFEVHDSGIAVAQDPADQIGEVSCIDDNGDLVLTDAGLEVKTSLQFCDEGAQDLPEGIEVDIRCP